MTGTVGVGKFSCGAKAEKRAGWWTSHEGSGLDVGLNLINLIRKAAYLVSCCVGSAVCQFFQSILKMTLTLLERQPSSAYDRYRSAVDVLVYAAEAH